MSQVITSLVLLICCCGPLLSAGQQPVVEAYIVENRGLYNVLKEKDFSYEYVANNPQTFPKLFADESLNQKRISYNSCILFFFFDGTQQVTASKLGFEVKLPVSSASTNYNDTLTLQEIRKQTAGIVSLRNVGKETQSPSWLDLTLVHENDELQTTFGFPYYFLPGENKAETLDLWEAAYQTEEGYSKYAYAHMMHRALRDPMYLSPLPVFLYPNSPYSNADYYDTNILEGNFSMPFNIMQGREDQVRFLRTYSVSVLPEFTWRISTEDSAPLFPLNTRVGLAFNKSFLDKKDRDTKWNYEEKDFDLDAAGMFRTTTASFILTHFSNGQDEGATLTDTDGSRMPDFFSGNFSVNSLQARVMRNTLHSSFRQVSWGGSVQVHIPGFDYEMDQVRRYGYVKLGGTVFVKSKPRKRFLFSRRLHHSENGGSIRTPALKQTTVRLDLDFVPDRISDFEGYDGNPFRRGSVRLRLIDDPTYNRSIGWFAQLYYGRDYLNIRYNLITFSAMFGLTFNFTKDKLATQIIRDKLEAVYDDCTRIGRKRCFRQ